VGHATNARRQHQCRCDAAQSAGTVLVFAWARSGEFDDPDVTLRLPNDQDAMIGAIADANPNTIVVLNSSSPHSHAVARSRSKRFSTWGSRDRKAAGQQPTCCWARKIPAAGCQ
jgi:hypothetical protein